MISRPNSNLPLMGDGACGELSFGHDFIVEKIKRPLGLDIIPKIPTNLCLILSPLFSPRCKMTW